MTPPVRSNCPPTGGSIDFEEGVCPRALGIWHSGVTRSLDSCDSDARVRVAPCGLVSSVFAAWMSDAPQAPSSTRLLTAHDTAVYSVGSAAD